MTVSIFLVLAVIWLAYANGANDNLKGVATLLGSKTVGWRGGLAWATVTTGAGSVLALVLSTALVDAFSGKGLVPDAVLIDPAFLLAVAAGAAATVLLATVVGMPISTTHALVGALAGAGLAVPGGGLSLGALGQSFVVPLAVSPLLALALSAILDRVGRLAGRLAGRGPRESSGPTDGEAPRSLGIDGLHVLSAGAVGFARGVNDTPKIVALLLAAQAVTPNLGLALVGVAMAAGGLLQARRVAATMSEEITPMSPGQGLGTNLTTALLVLVASRFGVPVSTTHVSCGALFGLGVSTGQGRWKTISQIVSSWVLTLPIAAVVAATVAAVASRLAAPVL